MDEQSEPRPDRCETCRFWDQRPTSGMGPCEIVVGRGLYPESYTEEDTGVGGVYLKTGICRRFPPSLLTSAKDDDWQKLIGEWPVTCPADWCGEWKSVPLAQHGLLSRPVNELGIPVRARDAAARVVGKRWNERRSLTLGELITCSALDLLAQHNFGQATLEETRSELALHGLKLKGD